MVRVERRLLAASRAARRRRPTSFLFTVSGFPAYSRAAANGRASLRFVIATSTCGLPALAAEVAGCVAEWAPCYPPTTCMQGPPMWSAGELGAAAGSYRLSLIG